MTVYMFVDYFDLYVNCEVFRSHSKMLDDVLIFRLNIYIHTYVYYRMAAQTCWI